MTDLPNLSYLLPDEKDALIRALWAQVQALTAQVQTLTARVAEQEARRWGAKDAGQLLRATLAGQEGQPRGKAQA